MPYDVQVTTPARRDLKGIPSRIVPAIVEFAFGDLAREPYRVGKPLQRELAGLHSAGRGPYRLIYRIDAGKRRVLIVRIDHRTAVYRPG